MTSEEWAIVSEAIDYAIEAAASDSDSLRKWGDEQTEWRADLLDKACSRWEEVHAIVKQKLPGRFADAVRR